jgi:hypothetical protein
MNCAEFQWKMIILLLKICWNFDEKKSKKFW